MKGCTTCKHLKYHTYEPPCAECLPAKPDFPLWEASDQVNELIAEAKKRAFKKKYFEGYDDCHSGRLRMPTMKFNQ